MANPVQTANRLKPRVAAGSRPAPFKAIRAGDEASVIQPLGAGADDQIKIARQRRAIFMGLNPGRLVHGADIGGLFTLGSGSHIKRNLLIFPEGLEPLPLNGREMREQILAAVLRGDETKTLCFVKPLNSTSRHYLDLEKIVLKN
jgi:hypothetical protein